MTLPRNTLTNVVPIDADERILRNLSKDDPYGAAAPLDATERQRLIASVLARADEEPVIVTGGRKPLRYAAVAAMVLIAGWIVFSIIELPQRPGTTPTVSPDGNRTAATAAARAVAPSDAPLAVQFASGPAVITPSNGISLALADDTRIEIRRPEKNAVTVRLATGSLWAAVDPAIVHDRLTVETAEGAVAVKGTVFHVTQTSNRSEVRVLRGKVAVTDRKGRSVALVAGHKTEVGSGQDQPLAAREIEAGWAAVESAALVRRSPDTLPGTSETAKSAKRRPTRPTPPSEALLLNEIRHRRRIGDWAGAAAEYEQLIRIHQNSPAARAALIALGELRIEKLGVPADALPLFERYLRLGDATLAREALWGKADALRAMGRRDEEKSTLREFLARFTDAVQAETARVRLKALEEDTQ